MTNSEVEWDRLPTECTLPTAEMPLRVAEFEDVFALVRAIERPARTDLLLTLQPAPGHAEDLA